MGTLARVWALPQITILRGTATLEAKVDMRHRMLSAHAKIWTLNALIFELKRSAYRSEDGNHYRYLRRKCERHKMHPHRSLHVRGHAAQARYAVAN